jgi:hypothetical protein
VLERNLNEIVRRHTVLWRLTYSLMETDMKRDNRTENKMYKAEPRRVVFEEDRLRPVYNERGIIAENYNDLQGLGVLASAKETYPLPKASDESTLRAVYQAAEIALLNLADVVARAAADLERETIGSAVVKVNWAHGFHRVLVRLIMMPHQLGVICDAGSPRGVLRICESPAFSEYVKALSWFDHSVVQCIESGDLQIETILAEWSLDSAEFNLIHLARICNHESTGNTIWLRYTCRLRYSPMRSSSLLRGCATRSTIEC